MTTGITLMHHRDADGEILVIQSWDGGHVSLDVRENGQQPVTVSMPSAWLYAIWDDGVMKRKFCVALENAGIASPEHSRATEREAAHKLAALGGTTPNFPDVPRRRPPKPEGERSPEQIAAVEAVLDKLAEETAPADTQPASQTPIDVAQSVAGARQVETNPIANSATDSETRQQLERDTAAYLAGLSRRP